MESLALLTDLYELTMACGYWRLGMAETESVFHLTFRRKPFGGNFAIACGLNAVIEALQNFHFSDSDLAYLKTLPGFEPDFFDYLKDLRFTCDVDAMPEGTVAFPHQPLLRVRGPLLQAQLVETMLLNLINFPTLIATKGARVARAAQGDLVMEFGLRRAQGPDGGVRGSRAAYIGGVQSTSNVLTGKLFDVPVRGTHAHSWVMSFPSELAAFEGWAKAMPDNCVLLIDTYDSLAAVDSVIKVAKEGAKVIGVRLDSGDLLTLSKAVRKKLDDAGLTDVAIVASNELDEWEITRLKKNGSPISIWGVGTRLATGHDQAALDGVYKLGAIRDGGKWSYRMKTSDERQKATEPGILQVRRFDEGDLVYDSESPPSGQVKGFDGNQSKSFDFSSGADLLEPIFRKGKLVYTEPTIHESREKALEALNNFPEEVVRLEDPISYFVGVEEQLNKFKEAQWKL